MESRLVGFLSKLICLGRQDIDIDEKDDANMLQTQPRNFSSDRCIPPPPGIWFQNTCKINGSMPESVRTGKHTLISIISLNFETHIIRRSYLDTCRIGSLLFESP